MHNKNFHGFYNINSWCSNNTNWLCPQLQVLDLTNSNDKLMFLSYQQCFILGHSASSTNTTHIKMHIFAYKKLYYGYQFDQTIKKKI